MAVIGTMSETRIEEPLGDRQGSHRPPAVRLDGGHALHSVPSGSMVVVRHGRWVASWGRSGYPDVQGRTALGWSLVASGRGAYGTMVPTDRGPLGAGRLVLAPGRIERAVQLVRVVVEPASATGA